VQLLRAPHRHGPGAGLRRRLPGRGHLRRRPQRPDLEGLAHGEPRTGRVRRPEKDTKPKLFYRGAHAATLDPLAAERPTGDIFAWAQQAQEDAHTINSGSAPGTSSSSAAAIIAYDVGHSVPWDWRVGLYTWTKSISAGVYPVVAALVVLGLLDAGSMLWTVVTPVVAGAFLAITGVVLIWDLEHPERFYYLLTRPQWKSWLVRGAVILGVYAAVLALHFVAGLLVGEPPVRRCAGSRCSVCRPR
jgi:hypothetical protein